MAAIVAAVREPSQARRDPRVFWARPSAAVPARAAVVLLLGLTSGCLKASLQTTIQSMTAVGVSQD